MQVADACLKMTERSSPQRIIHIYIYMYVCSYKNNLLVSLYFSLMFN